MMKVILALTTLLTVGCATSTNGADTAAPAAKADSMLVYVGTYSGPKSKGIYMMHFDLATGALSAPEVAAESSNPSFLALHPSKKYLYAVNEYWSNKAGDVSAYSIGDGGKLTLLNTQTAGGNGPCFISIDSTGTNALVANYGGGNISCVRIEKDGKLGEQSTFIQHKGTGGDPKRQDAPHAHCILPDPANKFVLANDLGLDKVLVYKFDASKGTLTPNDPPAGISPPASGPRHLAFSNDGKFAYVCNEMASTVTVFTYDAEHGALNAIQTLSMLPPDFQDKEHNSAAEIAVHPNGKFVYASNRGHNSIVIYSIDPATGKLTVVGHQSTQGKSPRNFAIDPTGTYMIAANQESNNIVTFRIDAKTGELKPIGTSIELQAPVCITFVPATH